MTTSLTLPTETRLAIGQDLFSIESYLNEQFNRSLHEDVSNHTRPWLEFKIRTKKHQHRQQHRQHQLLPSTYMIYTDLQRLRGLWTPADYGSGIEYMDGVLALHSGVIQSLGQSLPSSSSSTPNIQMGLWLAGAKGCRDIVQGRLDDQLDALWDYLLTRHKQGRLGMTYVRVGYEFDNPDFGYSQHPALFIEAYRYVVDNCRKVFVKASYHRHTHHRRVGCRDVVQFVWHSWAAGLPMKETNDTSVSQYSLVDFYPGNEVVDWIGMSVFSQLYNPTIAANEFLTNVSLLGNRQTIQDVLDFADQVAPDIPIMIAESTPYGGLDTIVDPWKYWFVPILELIAQQESTRNPIRMWSYINCDWNSQPMWQHAGFGDTRLSSNSTVMKLWRQHVLRFDSVNHPISHKPNQHGTWGLVSLVQTDRDPLRSDWSLLYGMMVIILVLWVGRRKSRLICIARHNTIRERVDDEVSRTSFYGSL